MTNCFSRIQHYSYSWPFCYCSKIIYMLENRFFYFYSISTLHIFLYFSILDRIIKYFPNMISLKKATKAVFGKKHFCLRLKGKQKCRMAFYFPCPYSLQCLYSTQSAPSHGRGSCCQSLVVRGLGTAIQMLECIYVVLTCPIRRAKWFLIYPGTLSTSPLFSWYD